MSKVNPGGIARSQRCCGGGAQAQTPPPHPAPPTVPPGENFSFERELLAYLSTYHYRNLGWCSDKGVRDTGDWVNTVYYGLIRGWGSITCRRWWTCWAT